MKYLVTSDIHLGGLRTPTSHICNSFRKCIITKENIDLDIIFIAGDIFDRLIDTNSKELLMIIELFNDLFNFCHTNNIKLRILEGTLSHDYNQSTILVKLNEIRQHKCDLKYHKVLDIEYIEQFNKHVLYIPDEWTNSHEELEKQIQDKLNQYSITNVDIAILHGQFKYQLVGKKYSGFFFKEEFFLPLVTGFIHVGHYHVYSRLDRIIVNGSLERLAHGEESPKGYVLVDNDKFTFIENKNSYTYTTINITNATTLERLDKIIKKFPLNSYVRLLLSKEHEFNINFTELKLRYLDYNLKKLIKENISESNSIAYILTDDNDIEVSDAFILDTDIYNLLLSNIIAKHTLTETENVKLLKYVELFKHVEGDNISEHEK